MRRSSLAGLILIGLALPFASGAAALQPRRFNQEDSLTRAMFAEGRLWLLSDAGELSTITEGADARVEAHLPEPVLDICTRDGHIEALTGAAADCKTWTIRRWAGGSWSAVTAVATQGDGLVGIDCAPKLTTVLTTRRLIESTDAGQKTVNLSETLEKMGVTSVLVTTDQIFVGVNRGEWGGGLRRIERRTGKLTIVEKNASGELCGGPLNTDCDPVNGIAPEPWKAGCVAAAIGLVHFSPHGRIVEICGDRVRRTYFRPYKGSKKMRPGEDEPYETVAFFGLARVKDELWASGIDGLHRLKGEQAPTIVSLPKFKSIGNISVSFDLPGAILVLTSVNRRLSISGQVPMLVPR